MKTREELTTELFYLEREYQRVAELVDAMREALDIEHSVWTDQHRVPCDICDLIARGK